MADSSSTDDNDGPVHIADPAKYFVEQLPRLRDVEIQRLLAQLCEDRGARSALAKVLASGKYRDFYPYRTHGIVVEHALRLHDAVQHAQKSSVGTVAATLLRAALLRALKTSEELLGRLLLAKSTPPECEKDEKRIRLHGAPVQSLRHAWVLYLEEELQLRHLKLSKPAGKAKAASKAKQKPGHKHCPKKAAASKRKANASTKAASSKRQRKEPRRPPPTGEPSPSLPQPPAEEASSSLSQPPAEEAFPPSPETSSPPPPLPPPPEQEMLQAPTLAGGVTPEPEGVGARPAATAPAEQPVGQSMESLGLTGGAVVEKIDGAAGAPLCAWKLEQGNASVVATKDEPSQAHPERVAIYYVDADGSWAQPTTGNQLRRCKLRMQFLDSPTQVTDVRVKARGKHAALILKGGGRADEVHKALKLLTVCNMAALSDVENTLLFATLEATPQNAASAVASACLDKGLVQRTETGTIQLCDKVQALTARLKRPARRWGTQQRAGRQGPVRLRRCRSERTRATRPSPTPLRCCGPS